MQCGEVNSMDYRSCLPMCNIKSPVNSVIHVIQVLFCVITYILMMLWASSVKIVNFPDLYKSNLKIWSDAYIHWTWQLQMLQCHYKLYFLCLHSRGRFTVNHHSIFLTHSDLIWLRERGEPQKYTGRHLKSLTCNIQYTKCAVWTVNPYTMWITYNLI